MNRNPEDAWLTLCAVDCSGAASIEDWNRGCFCLTVDPQTLHAQMDATLGAHGLPQDFAKSHPHLFSALPVYVSQRHIEQVAKVVTAIEQVTALPSYQASVMAWAPEIAAFDPGSPGGLLGLDFHLGPDGPRLIEINTNPGGVLLNALLGEAQHACMPKLTMPPADPAQVEEAVMAAMLAEWRLQRGSAPLTFVAIVDEAPAQQYLYPEFVMFRELFRRHGYRAGICEPGELVRDGSRLRLGDEPVDFVYNRLTDFSLQQPGHATLRDAYLSGSVVLSPHPRAHALYADKRNLAVLGNGTFLQSSGASQSCIDALLAAIPPTQLVTPENREALWADRRHLFFKPAAGFGSKASYRGDKLTRKVWDAIALGTYVAQEIVAPSERHVAEGADPLKVDIRCYAYRGEALLYSARMYQGQTTNFRTPGGGFAPVLTGRDGFDRA